MTFTTGTEPEIDIQRPAGTSIADGGTDALGNQIVGTINLTYTVDNSAGSAQLDITGVTASNLVNSSNFTVTTALPLNIAAGATVTIDISFDIDTAGAFSFDMAIANNDNDENPYTFSIQGTGTGPAPEMDVLGNGASISNGDTSPDVNDHTDFGDVAVTGGSLVYTFTIQNTGSVALNLSDSPAITISGTHAADFTLTSDATTPVPGAGGTATFEITFDPGETGLREATVSIANDDSDENPYTFSIQGTGVAP